MSVTPTPAAEARPLIAGEAPRAAASTTTRPEDRVPLKAKIASGAAGAVDVWANNIPNQLATPIFVTTLGLSPAIASLAMVIFRLYDAMIDTLMGWISDNTRSRWGRRKPYIFVGAILTGLAFPVMWQVGRDWSETALIYWLIGTGLLFYTCFAVWAMPYQSMMLELTPDYNERTSVSSYRTFFQKIAGLLVGWAWWLAQQPLIARAADGGPDTILGAQRVTLIAGALVIVLGMLPVFTTTERSYKSAVNQPKVSLKDNFRWTFANRPFLITALFTLFFVCASSLSNAFGFYLRLYYVSAGNMELASKLQGVESTIIVVLGILAIPAFNWLSQRIGKTWTLMTCMGLMLVGLVLRWWLFNPAYPWLSVVCGVLLAPAFTGIWQLIPSINGDVVDYDELRTGERREGAFASIFSWIVKASFSIGMGFGGPLVVWSGFVVSHGSTQIDGIFTHMRLLDAFLPATLVTLAMAVLLRYPLSPGRMQEVRAELEARRGCL
ncbi:MAG: MFS transporter [Opitutus sp.]|nr:MFS transporter [Opitutus sp.]MCS6246566.1 MFS transporter [Opitutus sp.]MCS6272749.1 MFS transporter [Opitutus sp.]MCS6276381.1 MFS transporter [Opitutus sp.]MCS6301971.1 MFS transporter [Opitutus sp.]